MLNRYLDEGPLIKAMREWCQQHRRKLTRHERLHFWLCARRLALARWIAGDSWQDCDNLED